MFRSLSSIHHVRTAEPAQSIVLELENPLIFIAGIVLVIAIVIWRLRDLLFFSFRAKESHGTITNWLSSKVNGVEVFHPVIEFQTETGESIRYRAEETCEGRPLYPVGTKVTVLYNPNKTSQVKTRYPKV